MSLCVNPAFTATPPPEHTHTCAADAKERGAGFTFSPPQPNAMLQAVDHAVHVFRGDRAAWQIIQKNGMEQARTRAEPYAEP